VKKLLPFIVVALFLVAVISGCGNEKSTNPGPSNSGDPASSNSSTLFATASATSTSFAYGADVSWVTQMEASGWKFYNKSGIQQDLFTILKSLGFNAIRLRVWVNPADGWCNKTDTINKAKRAVAAGMMVMIDFQYSDSWADPGKQYIPSAWTGHSTSQLYTDVWNYTLDVCNGLKSAGVYPTWVQCGNEVSNGMLWDNCKASLNMQAFAYAFNSGRNAVKQVFPDATVICHVANGQDLTKAQWLFDGLKNNTGNWDCCGFSLYPTASNWSSYDSSCQYNMNNLKSRYGTGVILCEVGFANNDPNTAYSFLKDIIAKAQSCGALGVFYWEPEAYNNWQGYGMGAFDTAGKPTHALDAFWH
jgi:Arabinogalactan endo-1,4-beta-galactosidase